MGFSLSVLAYSGDLPLDLTSPLPSPEPVEVLRAIYPRTAFLATGDTNLVAGGFPPRRVLNVGVFAGGLLIATADAHLYSPSKLAPRYLKPSLASHVRLLTQRSANDMFAYGHWLNGRLIRAISVNPVGLVWESVGDPEEWEKSFWEGQRPAGSDYPLPFHPLDLSDTALRSLLHLHYEGPASPDLVTPELVSLVAFERPAK